MSKSEFKRLCVQNPVGMAEKLHSLEQENAKLREGLEAEKKRYTNPRIVDLFRKQAEELQAKLEAAQSRIRVQDEAMQQVEARCAMLEDISFKAVNALQFYADEETWFATTLRPDRPAGEINDDYGETENLGVKPGRRARQAFDEIHVIAKNLSESDWLARNNNEVLERAAKECDYAINRPYVAAIKRGILSLKMEVKA